LLAVPLVLTRRNGLRRLRRAVVAFAILCVVFAQFAAAAHACVASSLPGVPTHAEQLSDSAGHGNGCWEHHRSTVPAKNLCEIHCSAASTAATATDLPPATLALLPLRALPLSALGALATPSRLHYIAASTSSAINLQFCRILV
jgi:hypothetical protein